MSGLAYTLTRPHIWTSQHLCQASVSLCFLYSPSSYTSKLEACRCLSLRRPYSQPVSESQSRDPRAHSPFHSSTLPELLTHLPSSSFFPLPYSTFRITTIRASLILSFTCLKTTRGSPWPLSSCLSVAGLNAHCPPKYTCSPAKQHVLLFTYTSMLFHVHTLAHTDSSSWNDRPPLPSPLSPLIWAYQNLYLIYV